MLGKRGGEPEGRRERSLEARKKGLCPGVSDTGWKFPIPGFKAHLLIGPEKALPGMEIYTVTFQP